jgi:hypothetical protein
MPMLVDILSYLLPPALLVLLILAPRRGGQPRWKGSNALAVFVAVWAVMAVLVGVLWERYGLALLWHATNAP